MILGEEGDLDLDLERSMTVDGDGGCPRGVDDRAGSCSTGSCTRTRASASRTRWLPRRIRLHSDGWHGRIENADGCPPTTPVLLQPE